MYRFHIIKAMQDLIPTVDPNFTELGKRSLLTVFSYIGKQYLSSFLNLCFFCIVFIVKAIKMQDQFRETEQTKQPQLQPQV